MNEYNPAKHIPSEDERVDDWLEEYASKANDANGGIQEAARNIVEAIRDGGEPEPNDVKELQSAVDEMGIALDGIREVLRKLPGTPPK